MNNASVKNKIVSYLQEKGGWIAGGKIEDHIRSMYGSKHENAGKRLRELTCDKIDSPYYIPPELRLVEKKYFKIIDGKLTEVPRGGNVYYRYKVVELPIEKKVEQLNLI